MAVVEQLKDYASSMSASADNAAQGAIDTLDKASKLNIASMAYYTDLGVKQLRAMSCVRDLESMRRFTAGSISVSGDIAKRMLEDSKAWMALGNEMKEVLASNMTAATETSASAATSATEQAQSDLDASKKKAQQMTKASA